MASGAPNGSIRYCRRVKLSIEVSVATAPTLPDLPGWQRP